MPSETPGIHETDRNISGVSHSDSARTSEQATNGSALSSTSHSSFSATTQCLRFETITDRESRVRFLSLCFLEACVRCAVYPNLPVRPMQRAILVMKLVVIFGDAGTSVLISVRRLKNAADLIVMNRKYLGVMAVMNGLFFISLVLGFALWAARVADSRRRGMKWTRRRTGVAQVRLRLACMRLKPSGIQTAMRPTCSCLHARLSDASGGAPAQTLRCTCAVHQRRNRGTQQTGIHA